MAEPLTSARRKLKRADDHLAEFNRRMKWFRDPTLGGFARELSSVSLNDPERKLPGFLYRFLPGRGKTEAVEHLYRVEIREPPPCLGPIVGDFFHNLRSSLDSIAYDLSLKQTPTLTPDGVPTPIQQDVRPVGEAVKDGEVLARFVFAKQQPDRDMGFHATIDVSIGESREVASFQLKRLLELVRDNIVPRFARFF